MDDEVHIEEVGGVPTAAAERLAEAGYETTADLVGVDRDTLADVEGVTRAVAGRLEAVAPVPEPAQHAPSDQPIDWTKWTTGERPPLPWYPTGDVEGTPSAQSDVSADGGSRSIRRRLLLVLLFPGIYLHELGHAVVLRALGVENTIRIDAPETEWAAAHVDVERFPTGWPGVFITLSPLVLVPPGIGLVVLATVPVLANPLTAFVLSLLLFVLGTQLVVMGLPSRDDLLTLCGVLGVRSGPAAVSLLYLRWGAFVTLATLAPGLYVLGPGTAWVIAAVGLGLTVPLAVLAGVVTHVSPRRRKRLAGELASRRAALAFLNGDRNVAHQLVDEAILTDPSRVRSHLLYGAMLGQQGRLRAAALATRRGLALDPTHLHCHLNLAALHARLGDDEVALDHAETALELAPESGLAHNNYAVALLGTEDQDAAEDHARKAVALADSRPETHATYASVLLETGEARAALERCRDAPDEVGESVDLTLVEAQALAETGDHETAAERFIDVLARRPHSVVAHEAYAEWLEERGRPADAAEHREWVSVLRRY